MKIQNHRLVRDDGTPYPFVSTPNMGGGFTPTWLVMHFTAGRNAQESISWLANSQAKASAHIVIARDGSITQMVPFDRIAWHAGKSTWKGVSGLNSHSIGIELDNVGRLVRKGDTWVAETFGGKIPGDQVLVAEHKNEPGKESGWQTYPKAQLDAARELAALLVQTYRLQDVIGHDDISPGRKVDPGPAFAMVEFRAEALGKLAEAAEAPAATGYFTVTATSLNVRSGPGTSHAAVAGSPLPQGTVVEGMEDVGGWKRVVVHSGGSEPGVTGWVSATYLRPVVPAVGIAGEPAEAAPAG